MLSLKLIHKILIIFSIFISLISAAAESSFKVDLEAEGGILKASHKGNSLENKSLKGNSFESKNLEEEVGREFEDILEKITADNNSGEDLGDNRLTPTPESKPKLYIFISKSMSLESIKEFHRQAISYGGVLVLNGLIENSFLSTALFITSITSDVGGIIIDPKKFEEYGITSVPSIVFAEDKMCSPGEICKPLFDKMTGNVPVSFALEKFSSEGSLSEEAAKIPEFQGNKEHSREKSKEEIKEKSRGLGE